MEKIGCICTLKSGRSIPKKGPLRIYGLWTYLDVSHYLGLSSPDLKCIWTAVYFFSWEPGYIRHPSHGKDWVPSALKIGEVYP